MADPIEGQDVDTGRLQELYSRVSELGGFKEPGSRIQQIGHRLRELGAITDPTQGGLVNPNPPPAQAPIAPPETHQIPLTPPVLPPVNRTTLAGGPAYAMPQPAPQPQPRQPTWTPEQLRMGDPRFTDITPTGNEPTAPRYADQQHAPSEHFLHSVKPTGQRRLPPVQFATSPYEASLKQQNADLDRVHAQFGPNHHFAEGGPVALMKQRQADTAAKLMANARPLWDDWTKNARQWRAGEADLERRLNLWQHGRLSPQKTAQLRQDWHDSEINRQALVDRRAQLSHYQNSFAGMAGQAAGSDYASGDRKQDYPGHGQAAQGLHFGPLLPDEVQGRQGGSLGADFLGNLADPTNYGLLSGPAKAVARGAHWLNENVNPIGTTLKARAGVTEARRQLMLEGRYPALPPNPGRTPAERAQYDEQTRAVRRYFFSGSTGEGMQPLQLSPRLNSLLKTQMAQEKFTPWQQSLLPIFRRQVQAEFEAKVRGGEPQAAATDAAMWAAMELGGRFVGKPALGLLGRVMEPLEARLAMSRINPLIRVGTRLALRGLATGTAHGAGAAVAGGGMGAGLTALEGGNLDQILAGGVEGAKQAGALGAAMGVGHVALHPRVVAHTPISDFYHPDGPSLNKKALKPDFVEMPDGRKIDLNSATRADMELLGNNLPGDHPDRARVEARLWGPAGAARLARPSGEAVSTRSLTPDDVHGILNDYTTAEQQGPLTSAQQANKAAVEQHAALHEAHAGTRELPPHPDSIQAQRQAWQKEKVLGQSHSRLLETTADGIEGHHPAVAVALREAARVMKSDFDHDFRQEDSVAAGDQAQRDPHLPTPEHSPWRSLSPADRARLPENVRRILLLQDIRNSGQIVEPGVSSHQFTQGFEKRATKWLSEEADRRWYSAEQQFGQGRPQPVTEAAPPGGGSQPAAPVGSPPASSLLETDMNASASPEAGSPPAAVPPPGPERMAPVALPDLSEPRAAPPPTGTRPMTVEANGRGVAPVAVPQKFGGGAVTTGPFEPQPVSPPQPLPRNVTLEGDTEKAVRWFYDRGGKGSAFDLAQKLGTDVADAREIIDHLREKKVLTDLQDDGQYHTLAPRDKAETVARIAGDRQAAERDAVQRRQQQFEEAQQNRPLSRQERRAEMRKQGGTKSATRIEKPKGEAPRPKPVEIKPRPKPQMTDAVDNARARKYFDAAEAERAANGEAKPTAETPEGQMTTSGPDSFLPQVDESRGELIAYRYTTPEQQAFEDAQPGMRGDARYQAMQERHAQAARDLRARHEAEWKEAFEKADPSDDAAIAALKALKERQSAERRSLVIQNGRETMGLLADIYREQQAAPQPVEAKPAPEAAPKAYEGPERRQDAATRRRVDEMSPTEMRHALLTDAKTGLGNERAWNEVSKKAHVASVDADSLKWVNDHLNHAAGDQVLGAVGTALRHAGLGDDFFRPHGDEFVGHHDNPVELRQKLDLATELLKEAEISYTDKDGVTHTYKGLGISYGIAEEMHGAEENLKVHKGARQAAGERAARGERPAGLAEVGTGGRTAAPAGEAAGEAAGAGADRSPASEARPVVQRLPKTAKGKLAAAEATLKETLKTANSARFKELGATHPEVLETVKQARQAVAEAKREAAKLAEQPATKGAAVRKVTPTESPAVARAKTDEILAEVAQQKAERPKRGRPAKPKAEAWVTAAPFEDKVHPTTGRHERKLLPEVERALNPVNLRNDNARWMQQLKGAAKQDLLPKEVILQVAERLRAADAAETTLDATDVLDELMPNWKEVGKTRLQEKMASGEIKADLTKIPAKLTPDQLAAANRTGDAYKAWKAADHDYKQVMARLDADWRASKERPKGYDETQAKLAKKAVDAEEAYKEALKAENAARQAEPAKKTRGKKGGEVFPPGTRFHGSSGPVELGPTYDRHQSQNLYGPGFYTTENPEIAASYMKKGKGGEPSAYTAEWTGAKPPRFLDLEQPLPPAVHDIFDREHQYTEKLDFSRPGKEIYRELKDGWQDAGFTRDDAEEAMHNIVDALSQRGYDGFQHIGGRKADAIKHPVSIYFHPVDPVTGQPNLRLTRLPVGTDETGRPVIQPPGTPGDQMSDWQALGTSFPNGWDQTTARPSPAAPTGERGRKGGQVGPNRKMVDKLAASPAFGEHYAENYGNPDQVADPLPLAAKNRYAEIHNGVRDFFHGFTRIYKEIQNSAEHAELTMRLLRRQSAEVIAHQAVEREIRRALRGLSPDERQVLEMDRYVTDMLKDVSDQRQRWHAEGGDPKLFKALLGGVSETDAIATKQRITDYLQNHAQGEGVDVARINAAHQKIVDYRQKAIDRFQDLYFKVNGTKLALDPDTYFRHQILYLDAAQQAMNGAGAPRVQARPGRGHLKARLGSDMAYNTSFIESEMNWLPEMVKDTLDLEILHHVDQTYNVAKELKLAKVAANDPGMIAAIEAHLAGRALDTVRLDTLAKLAAENHLPDRMNGEHREVLQSLAQMHKANLRAQGLGQPKVGLSPEAQVALRDYLKFLRKDDGKGKVSLRSVTEDKNWQRRNGYAEYQAIEGRHFYRAMTVSERTMRDSQAATLAQIIGDNGLKQVLAVGAQRRTMIVPTEIKSLLENYTGGKIDAHETALQGVLTWGQKAWKWNKLYNPANSLRYGIGNLLSDMPAIVSGNPDALRFAPRAVKEFWNVAVRGHDPSPEFTSWLDRGGERATLLAQEGMDPNGGLSLWGSHGSREQPLWKRVTTGAKQLAHATMIFPHEMREGVGRYAAYLSFLDQVKKGNGFPTFYGASDPASVNEIKGLEDKAWKLSNELVGAYDQVSHQGQFLRKSVFPFWSWQEVAVKREVQFLKNALYAPQIAAAAGHHMSGGRVAGVRALALGRYLGGALMLGGIAEINNRWRFGNDYRQKLPKELQGRFAPVFIHRLDEQTGQFLYSDRPGNLVDVSNWLNLNNGYGYVTNWLNRKMTLSEIADDFVHQGLPDALTQGLGSRLLQQVNPVFKSPYEVFLGLTTYPDPTQPHKVDPWEALFEQASLGKAYKTLKGVPQPPPVTVNIAGREIGGRLPAWAAGLAALPTMGQGGTLYGADALHLADLKTLDLHEANYFDVKGDAAEWKRKKSGGTGFPGTESDSMKTAAYYFRLSLRYHDMVSAERFLWDYARAGGTDAKIHQSLLDLDPLHALKQSEQARYLDQLDLEGKERLRRAYRHWGELVAPDVDLSGYQQQKLADFLLSVRTDVKTSLKLQFGATSPQKMGMFMDQGKSFDPVIQKVQAMPDSQRRLYLQALSPDGQQRVREHYLTLAQRAAPDLKLKVDPNLPLDQWVALVQSAIEGARKKVWLDAKEEAAYRGKGD